MILVTKDSLTNAINVLSKTGVYGLDTETYGIRFLDRLFGISIATKETEYYFDFISVLGREHLKALADVLSNPSSTWFIHNAKFDLQKLALEDLAIAGTVYCTQVNERILNNSHMSYSLAACAERRGWEKMKDVMDYMKKNRLYELVHIPGKKQRARNYHFDKVPLEIMQEYAGVDARLHYDLGVDQLESMPKECKPILENETKLIKVIHQMIMTGIKIDRDYVEKAIDYEQSKITENKIQFHSLTNMDYGNGGRKVLHEAFVRKNLPYELSDKGNPVFNDEALKKLDNPIANTIKKIRFHEKNLGTYYSSFIYYADENDVVHGSPNQAGTATGRFSYSDPNLQNVPKQEDANDSFIVRKSFIPRDDYIFVMIDYNQMEFRMLLDYAGQHDLIAEINEGKDVHQATADMVGITRKLAKTLNFGLLYGMGIGKLSNTLGITVHEASKVKEKYYSKLRKIQKLNQSIIRIARSRGYIKNCKSRICTNIKDREYVMINHLIQGGCADVIKFSMVQLDQYLTNKKSRMLVQVHDEILFEIHKSEYGIINKIKGIMEDAYTPFNNMNLTCSVEYSPLSWGSCDKIDGTPV